MAGNLKLGVLISGGGTNLQAIIDACQRPDFPAEIAVVISNKASAYGVQRAKSVGIPTAIISHKDYNDRNAFDSALHDTLMAHDVQLVCLAGFMRILTPSFTEKWEGKMINTHPSLLPKFGGAGMYGHHVHQAVLAAGETKSGVTIHYVTAGVDEGPILIQREVDVLPGDTTETLSQRVLEQEHIAYIEAIEKIAR